MAPVTVVAIAVVIGGPVGIAVGRALYPGGPAEDLGVVPVIVVSWPWIVIVVLAALVVALLAAAGPARRTVREPAAAVLRHE